MKKEIQYIRDGLYTPRQPIEKSNLSVNTVRVYLVFSFAGLLLLTAAIAYQLFRYLHHTEEYLIGGSLIVMTLFSHFLFVFICLRQLSKDDFPEITPENGDEIYRKLAEHLGRSERRVEIKQSSELVKGNLWMLPLILVWSAALMFSGYAFIKTPFGNELIYRINTYRWRNEYYPIDSRIIATAKPESQVKIAASGVYGNFWTLVFTPLGFAGDDDGCLLYSDLIRESLFLQTQNETVKPFVEPMLSAPDFLMIPFYFKVEKRNDAAHYLENVVFGNQLDEPTFDAAKTAVLKKLFAEKSNADVCASKFALAARRQVFDFGKQNVVLLADLEKTDWGKFQEYYRSRFSREQIPLVFLSGEQSIGAALDEIEQQLESLPIDAKRSSPQQRVLT
ncbi:MAG: hypothetical protein FWE67_12140, partial [Planctomycetaceae bacterium]|nr:hypothetical protein [Planctomycetaceae bacterium]